MGQAPSFTAPYQQNKMPQVTPAAGKRANPLTIFLSGVLVCIAVTGAVLLFIKPGYMLKKDDDSVVSSVTSSKSSEAEEKSAAETTTEKAAKTSAESVAETTVQTTTVTTAPAETETTPETTTAPKEEPETTAVSTEAPETVKNTEADKAKSEAESFSTYERPSFGDFKWCYGQFGLVRDPFEGCEFLTEPASWSGGWKCMIVYTVSDNYETYIREVNNVDIGVDGSSLTLKMMHYLYEVDGESFDDTVTADFDFSGEVYEGMFDATGVGRVTMTCFWKKDGHEYAVGDYLQSDGTDAYIAFMR